MSISNMQRVIRDAAIDAKSTGDYLSYATVLDEQFTNMIALQEGGEEDDNDEEDSAILTTDQLDYLDEQTCAALDELLLVLSNDPKMISEIGWDIPELITRLISMENHFRNGVGNSDLFKKAAKILLLISQKGNPKELFLKACEGLESLDLVNDDNYHIIAAQFFSLFELMMQSLHRIDVQHPSAFLAQAILYLLNFMNTYQDLRLTTTCARRLLLFLRDYHTASSPKQNSDLENLVQVKLLQSFLFWSVYLMVVRYPPSWSLRYAFDIRSKSATAMIEPPLKVSLVSSYESLNDSLSRFVQTAWSYDLELEELFLEVIEGQTADRVVEIAARSVLDNSTPWDYTSVVHKDDAVQHIGIVDEGVFILYTVQVFETKRVDHRVTLKKIMGYARRCLDDDVKITAGLIDAFVFWGLFFSTRTSPEAIKEIDQKSLCSYLQIIEMATLPNAQPSELKSIVTSLVRRLLLIKGPETAFYHIQDTIQYCPFEPLKDIMIRLLKDFVRCNGSKNGSAVNSEEEDIAKKLDSLNIGETKPFIALDDAKLKVIKGLVLSAVDELQTEGLSSQVYGVVMTWLNFLTVVETDREFLKEVKARVKVIVPPPPSKKKGPLKISSDSDNESDATDKAEQREPQKEVETETVVATAKNSDASDGAEPAVASHGGSVALDITGMDSVAHTRHAFLELSMESLEKKWNI